MPFVSKAQARACWATNGFHGAIDCHEWAHATPSIKSLPSKLGKQTGGYMTQADATRFAGLRGQVSPVLPGGAVPIVNANGTPYVGRQPQINLANTVPNEIGLPDIYQTKEGFYGYDDPHTGNFTPVNSSVLQTSRFRKEPPPPAYLPPLPSFGTTSVVSRKFGGYFQDGGQVPQQEDYPDYESYQQALDNFIAQLSPSAGRNPYMTNNAGVNLTTTPSLNPQLHGRPPQGDFANLNPPAQRHPLNLQNLGIAVQAGTTGLAWLSGIMDRKRQNQYLYNQYATLGQNTSPQPYENFQPNAYNLYAKYGGSLKNHRNFAMGYTNKAIHGAIPDDDGKMQFGGNITMKNPFSGSAKYGGKMKKKRGQHVMPMMNDHDEDDMMQGGGLSRAKNYGSSKKPYPSVAASDFAGSGRSYPIPTRADAIDALRLAHLHGRQDVIAKVHAKYPELKSGGKWIQKAINPSHKGWCTPMSKPTCTGHRRAFALMMKKKHGFQ